MANTNREKIIEKISNMNYERLADFIAFGMGCTEEECPLFGKCEDNQMDTCYWNYLNYFKEGESE